MSTDDWAKAFDELRESLVTVERKANYLSVQLPNLRNTLESLKVDIIRSKLEQERRRVARVRGVTVLKQHKRYLGLSLGLGIAGLVLGRALSGDNDLALSTGLGAFDTALQHFGKSVWAVSLDRTMLVVPRDQTTAGRFWVTWESLNEAMEKLQEGTVAGKRLGDLEAIVSELKRDHPLPRYLLPSPSRRADSQE